MLFWHEAQLKSQVFIEYGPWMERAECVFTSFKFTTDGIVFWDDHYNRLKESSFFYWEELAVRDWDKIDRELFLLLTALADLKSAGRIRINIYSENDELKILAKIEMGEFLPFDMRLKTVRHSINSTYPSFIKHPQYAQMKFWLKDAQRTSFNDVLYRSGYENIYECSTSNFFIIKNKMLMTAANDGGIFAGIMRQKIIDEAKKHGIAVNECLLTMDDIKVASAAFTSNCVYGIRVVKKIDQYEFDSDDTLVYIQKIFNDLIVSSRSWTCPKK